MNYVLNLQLEGAEQINSALDGLLKKVGSIGGGAGGKIDFAEYLGAGQAELNELEGKGDKAGKKFATSFGGGIKQILNGPNWMKELETQLDSLFKVDPEAKLEAMRKKSEAAFQKSQEKEQASREKAIGKREDFELAGRNKVAMLPDFASLIKEAVIPWKKIGMSELAAKYQKIAIPQTPAWMTKDFFKEKPKQASIKDYGIAGLATLFNPFIGARAFENIGKQNKGENMLGSESYVKNFVLLKVLEKAASMMVAAFQKIFESAEKAQQVYSRALTSGLGIGFANKRGIQAGILGVSEQEVLQFGAALNYINPKIEQATKSIEKSIMPLTTMNIDFKMLKLEVDALTMSIAAQLAPAITGIINLLSNLVAAFTKFSTEIAVVIKAAVGGIFQAVLTPILGPLGAKLASKFAGLLISSKSDVGALPTPQSYMKQMPASSWEKLGLIVGGGTNNYAQQTAKNTKDIADMMRASRRGNSGASQPFGMNLMTSNA